MCHQHISVFKKATARSGPSLPLSARLSLDQNCRGCNTNDAEGRAISIRCSDLAMLQRVKNKRRCMSKHHAPSLSLSLWFCPSVSSSISAPTLSLLSLSSPSPPSLYVTLLKSDRCGVNLQPSLTPSLLRTSRSHCLRWGSWQCSNWVDLKKELSKNIFKAQSFEVLA